MKQIVLIIPSVGAKINIEASKTKIVSYVGTRMVMKDSCDATMPGILVKEPLLKEDKEYLQKSIFTDGCGALAFITIPEDTDILSYIDAELVYE